MHYVENKPPMNLSTSSKAIFLQVIPSMDFGGAEIQTLQQVNYLHQNGFEVYLVILSELRAYPIEVLLPQNHIEVLQFAHESLTFPAVRTSFKLLQPLLKLIEKRQVTHVIAQLPLSHWVMRLVKMQSKKRNFRLFQYHRAIQYEENPLNTLGKKLFNRVNYLLAKSMDDGNIFVSQAAYQNVSQHLFVRNPIVIFNAVAERAVGKDLALAYLQNHNLSKRDFLMVLPGRVLAEVKGHRLLIAAFEVLKARFGWSRGEAMVIFAGGGRSKVDLEQELEEKNLKDFFHCTDFIENSLLLSFLQLADVVVIPSIAEGFGNVAVEALMQQSKIVCSNAGGLKEIVFDGKNGWVFEKGNTDALTEKLTFIYKNRSQELVDKQSLLEDFQTRFTLEGQMQKLITYLNKPQNHLRPSMQENVF